MSRRETQRCFQAVVNGLERHLALLKEEGLTTLELTPSDGKQHRPSLETVPLSPPKALPTLEQIAVIIAACTKCRLHEKRTRTVPGQGHPHPDILFIGEGPGRDEDEQGLAFVGRAGQLLTQIIRSMGYTREEVFIANIVKCRPPDNRKPEPDEIQACLPYLKDQIALLKPTVIVALGASAMEGLFGIASGISRLRGRWMTYAGIDVMPTFHPSYLLRNEAAKKDVWQDMKAVLKRLGRQPPPTQGKASASTATRES
ncbi:MAG: uracil-DNA glycosylase [Lentisphaerae bacterium]|nr:uracil-DNA glycosylase [Lentisphaerota bacterium]